MSVTNKGLIFDSPSESHRFKRAAKADLYKAGWVWTGRCWFLKETRKPGKTLLIELSDWREAFDWEQLMSKMKEVTP